MIYTKNSHCSFCGTRFVEAQPWPRTCPNCGQTSYINPLPVAVVLVPVDGGLLTVRRAIPPRVGLLALPGGFISVGESWQAAGAREVWEETGLQLAPDEIGDFTALSAPDGTVLIFGLAAARVASDVPVFAANHEVSELIVINEPVELAFPLHTDVMRRFFKR